MLLMALLWVNKGVGDGCLLLTDARDEALY